MAHALMIGPQTAPLELPQDVAVSVEPFSFFPDQPLLEPDSGSTTLELLSAPSGAIAVTCRHPLSGSEEMTVSAVLRPPESPAERAALLRIRAAAGLKPKAADPRFQDRLRDDGDDRHLLGLFVDGVAVGTLRLDMIGDGRVAMRRVAVAPGQQGRGYGSLLMRTSEALAASLGAVAMVLHAVPSSIGFYHAHGYHPADWDELAENLACVDMAKDLTQMPALKVAAA